MLGHRADSTGRRNTFNHIRIEQPVESLSRRSPAQRLAGPAIESVGQSTEFIGPMLAEVRSFRRILAQQAVYIFVAAALPGALRVAEVNLKAGVYTELSMLP